MYVRPHPGASREHLLTVLNHAHTTAVNARGVHGNALECFREYIRWADEAHRQLRNQVSSESIDNLVLTRRYWALQTIPSADDERLRTLVRAEMDDRIIDLEAASKQLNDSIQRWTAPGHFVVADTSVFMMHRDKFDELDWAAAIEARPDEAVYLVIPLLVIDELDKKKSEGRFGWRAAYSLAVVDRLFSASRLAATRPDSSLDLHSNVTIELFLDPPGHIRLPRIDDEIVGQARAIASLANNNVQLVTFDTGMAFRARLAGLRVHKLGKKLMHELAQPKDPKSRSAIDRKT